MASLLAAGNQYASANLPGLFPEGRDGVIEMSNNRLAALDVSGTPGLASLNASNNHSVKRRRTPSYGDG